MDSPSTTSNKEALRILVADDHQLTRNLVKSILRGLGFGEISLVDNGSDAITTALAEKFDLVICDWNMPRATGLEVLQAIRNEGRKVPFLMLTAEAYRENVMAAIQSGASDYVVKPFTAEVLGEKVNRVLKL